MADDVLATFHICLGDETMCATETRQRVFKITFHIDGLDYRVYPLQVEHPQKAYRIKKPDGGSYDVLLSEEGHYSCEC